MILSVLVALCVGYAEWTGGPRGSMSIFYLLPIVVGTWYVGLSFGLALALGVAALRFWIHTTGALFHDLPGLGGWNEIYGLVGSVIVVLLLAKVKAMSEMLDRKVEERTAALMGEIVERKRAEELLRTLTVQLSEAEEAERTRLAADIHDSIGQSLSVLKMNLGVLAGRINGNGNQPPALEESLVLIDDIVKQVRTFTFKIHPAMLEDLGLVPTLQWYAEQFEAHSGTQVTVSESGERQPVPAALATYLFRAIKELLNNAAKHGRAKEVIIAVHWRPGSVAKSPGEGSGGLANGGIRIVLDDDGCGFNPLQALAPETRQGLGLAGIRERLLTLGGHLAVESETGEGARVIVEVALPTLKPEEVAL
jgi:signal transduction histidine kinase